MTVPLSVVIITVLLIVITTLIIVNIRHKNEIVHYYEELPMRNYHSIADAHRSANNKAECNAISASELDEEHAYDEISECEDDKHHPRLEQVLLGVSRGRHEHDISTSHPGDDGVRHDSLGYESVPTLEPAQLLQPQQTERDEHLTPKQHMSGHSANGNTDLSRAMERPQLEGNEGPDEPNKMSSSAGYERVKYDPRLEQVVLNLQRRAGELSAVPAIEHNSSADVASSEIDETRSSQVYERVKYDPRLEQMILNLQRRGDEVSAIERVQDTRSPDIDISEIDQTHGSEVYECVKYDPRLEQMILNLQRRPGGVSDVPAIERVQDTSTADIGISEIDQTHGSEVYECVKYDPRLEQMILNLQRRPGGVSDVPAIERVQDTSTADIGISEIDQTHGSEVYERVKYDPRLEQMILNLQRRAGGVPDVPVIEHVQESSSADIASSEMDQTHCSQVYERVQYDHQLEQMSVNLQRSAGGNDLSAESASQELLSECVNYDPRLEQVSQATQRSGDAVEQEATLTESLLNEPQQSDTSALATGEMNADPSCSENTEDIYETISGYERVTYDPRLVRALFHRSGAVRHDGASDLTRTIIL